MSLAHVDPDHLREFSQILEQFARDTKDNLLRVNGLLQEMGNSSWQDERHQEFTQQFEEVQRLILNAAETIESEQVPRLHQLADQAEEYLEA